MLGTNWIAAKWQAGHEIRQTNKASKRLLKLIDNGNYNGFIGDNFKKRLNQLSQTKAKINLTGAQFHAGADLKGAQFRNTVLDKANLSSEPSGLLSKTTDLRNTNFSNVMAVDTNFSYSRMNESDFTNANIQNAKFQKTKLNGAIFKGAKMQGAILSEAILEGAKLTEANLQAAHLNKAKLKGADFSGATLQLADLNFARAENTNFSGIKASSAKLIGLQAKNALFMKANLKDAVLSYANIENGNFSGAKLDNADFKKAQIKSGNFTNASLKEANLSGAVLEKANFKNANLTNANLFSAKLKDVDFSQAKLNNANLRNCDLRGNHTLLDANLSGADLRGAKIEDKELIELNKKNTGLRLTSKQKKIVEEAKKAEAAANNKHDSTFNKAAGTTPAKIDLGKGVAALAVGGTAGVAMAMSAAGKNKQPPAETQTPASSSVSGLHRFLVNPFAQVSGPETEKSNPAPTALLALPTPAAEEPEFNGPT